MKEKGKNIFIRIIKRLLILLVVILILISAAGFLISYFYGDKVKEIVVNEINQQLAVEVEVDEIEFSVFKNFPKASINITGVQTREKLNKNANPLLKAKELAVLFNIRDIISGNYTIKRILLKDAFLNIVVFNNGTNNFTIFKSPDSKNGGEVNIDLNEVDLINVHVSYLDYQTDQEYLFIVNSGIMSGGFSSSAYALKISANILTNYLRTGKTTFLKEKTIITNVLFDIDNENHLFKIKKGDLKINTLSFNVDGNIQTVKNDKAVFLKVKAKKARLKDFLKEIPREYFIPLEDFDCSGIFDFTATIDGVITKNQLPEITFNFGLTKGKIKYLPTGLALNDVSFNGKFNNGKLRNKKTFSLLLSDFISSMKSGKMKGKMEIINFERPDVSVAFSASGKLDEVKKIFHIDTLNYISGDINIDLIFRNRLKSFSKFTIEDFLSSKTSGKLKINNADFGLKESLLSYKNFNGSFRFSNDDLIIDHFSGMVSGSDFQMKGAFINILPYFFLPGKSFSVNATLKSSMLNFDELLQYKTSGSDTLYRIRIPENINIILDLSVKRMQFRKFRAQDISGKLIIRNESIIVKNGSFSSMEGHTNIEGIIDGTNPTKLILTCDADIQKVDISKLFYEFGNFGQNNITSRKLKGRVNAKVFYESSFSNTLKIDPTSVNTVGDITIENGELINYTPLYTLGRFLKNKNLQHIRFSTLKNQIAIRNRIIYIPEMEIKSSTLDLSLNGTHTFDNEIDYHIWILLSEILSQKKQKEMESEIEGLIIEDDNLGRTSIPIKMTGKSSNPKISYDTKMARNKISTNMKKEKENIREVFRKEFGVTGNQEDDKNPIIETKEDGKEQFIIEWEETKPDSAIMLPKKPSQKSTQKKQTKKTKDDKADFIIEWDEDEDTIKSEPHNF